VTLDDRFVGFIDVVDGVGSLTLVYNTSSAPRVQPGSLLVIWGMDSRLDPPILTGTFRSE
jgi:hypothetical protein